MKVSYFESVRYVAPQNLLPLKSHNASSARLTSSAKRCCPTSVTYRSA